MRVLLKLDPIRNAVKVLAKRFLAPSDGCNASVVSGIIFSNFLKFSQSFSQIFSIIFLFSKLYQNLYLTCAAHTGQRCSRGQSNHGSRPDCAHSGAALFRSQNSFALRVTVQTVLPGLQQGDPVLIMLDCQETKHPHLNRYGQ